MLLFMGGLCLTGTAAVAQESSDAYARYYGDGLRHYAQGNFSQAVENLFRAYAIMPKASTLGLIVGSYDKLGFCDAAARQLDVHRLVHPDTEAPVLNRCNQTGILAIACEGPVAAITIDRRFEVACDQEVALPVGEHHLSAERVDAPKKVVVTKGERIEIVLKFTPAPKRWKSATGSAGVPKLPDSAANVARLEGEGGLGYTVFQTKEGLFRVFIHPGPTDPGQMISLPMRPDVLRLCDSGEQFDRKASQCVPVQGMQIQKIK